MEDTVPGEVNRPFKCMDSCKEKSKLFLTFQALLSVEQKGSPTMNS